MRTSPYLSRSAYETLKARGVTLISEPRLRSSVVRLYENVSTNLVGDSDRAEWVNYEALLDDRAFRTALLRTKTLRHGTIEETELAIAATEEVLARIDGSPYSIE